MGVIGLHDLDHLAILGLSRLDDRPVFTTLHDRGVAAKVYSFLAILAVAASATLVEHLLYGGKVGLPPRFAGCLRRATRIGRLTGSAGLASYESCQTENHECASHLLIVLRTSRAVVKG